MKKAYILILVFLLSFILIGCSNSTNSSSTTSTNDTNDSDDPNESMNSEGSDILIAYFSQTGNTQRVAEYISADTNGNLYQIIPAQPYSQEDIDYNSENSRTQQEADDDAALPVISGEVNDIEKYNYVFVGYPIWYNEAPKIIYTFLESYDFSGKTIIPFCTSNSSDIENSLIIRELAKNSTWLPGKRFPSDVTEQEVTDWVNSLDLKE